MIDLVPHEIYEKVINKTIGDTPSSTRPYSHVQNLNREQVCRIMLIMNAELELGLNETRIRVGCNETNWSESCEEFFTGVEYLYR